MLELGAGLGLPALAAAVAGGRVLATDWAADAVAMAARNAAHNGLAVATAVFRWDADPSPLGPPWPLVLASDVLYERRNVDPLLALLPRVTAAAGEVWTEATEAVRAVLAGTTIADVAEREARESAAPMYYI